MQLANVPARRLALVALWATLVCETSAPALASGEASTTVVPLPVGAQVASLAIGAGAVWVANARAGTVSRIDPELNEVVATIRVAEPSPTCDRCGAAVAACGDGVWVAMDAAGAVVIRIDPATNDVAQTVEVGVLPSALAVGEGGALWLTATLENTVIRVDPRVVGAVSRTAVHSPQGIIAGQEAIWVTARNLGSKGQLVRIDPRTNVVLATIPVGLDPGALAVSDADVWVANEADHTLSRIDAHTNTVAATIPVVHQPVGAVTGDDAVWIASRGSPLLSQPSVSRVDPSTNTVVEMRTFADVAPVSLVAGEGSLWVASRNPDVVMRIGPVPLLAKAPADGPMTSVAIWLGAALVAAAGVRLRKATRRQVQQSQRNCQMLGALLEMRRRSSYSRAAGGAGQDLLTIATTPPANH